MDIAIIDKILSTSYEEAAKSYGYTSGNVLKKRLNSANLPTKKDKLAKYYFNKTGKEHPWIIKQKEKEKLKTNRKPTIIKVNQYNLNGELINTFNSMNEAARVTGIHSGHISDCCIGKRKKTKNFIWKYAK